MTEQELRNMWTQALRSGDYEQDRYQLRTYKGYCCFGVLCDLVMPEKWAHSPNLFRGFQAWIHTDSDTLQGQVISQNIQNMVGLDTETCIHLAKMNDSYGNTFDEIADYIDALPAPV